MHDDWRFAPQTCRLPNAAVERSPALYTASSLSRPIHLLLAIVCHTVFSFLRFTLRIQFYGLQADDVYMPMVRHFTSEAPPAIHEKNGAAEGSGNALQQMAGVMLQQAQFPPAYWAHATLDLCATTYTIPDWLPPCR